MARQMNASSIPRWRFMIYLTIALIGAGLFIHKAYQRNFNNKALTQIEQQQLQVTLLNFPRNIAPLSNAQKRIMSEAQKSTVGWLFFYVRPVKCHTRCLSYLAQIKELAAPIQVVVLQQEHTHYQEIWQLVRSQNYSEHFDKVLLLNSAGKFAGSVSAPYSQERMIEVFNTLHSKANTFTTK